MRCDIFKNTALQKLTVLAFADAGHASLDAGEPVTGDAANISCKVEQDDDGTQTATNDVAPTEVEGGQYRFDLTQAETNGDKLTFYPQSSTAGVQVVCLPSSVIYTRPPNFGALGIESDGDITSVGNVPTAAEITDAVWDEATSGHNTSGTFGRAVKKLYEGLVSAEGAVDDVSATTISFVTDLTETTDEHYRDLVLAFVSGNLTGSASVVENYDGTTKTITLDETLVEAPANGDEFVILAAHVHTVTSIAEEVRSEMDSNSTQLADIVEDTSGLQAGITDLQGDVTDIYDAIGVSIGGTNLTLTGMTNTSYDGTYAVSTFEGSFSMIAETVVVDTNYKVFKEDIGGGSFNVVIRETVVGAWQARLSTTDPDTWTAGDSVGTAYEVITGSSETQDGKNVPSSVSSKVSYVESATTSDLATEANVDAVKATTDQFVFTVANQVDANALTGGGGGTAPTVEQIRTEMDDNSTKLAAIVADTNELQSDDIPATLATLATQSDISDLQGDVTDIYTAIGVSVGGTNLTLTGMTNTSYDGTYAVSTFEGSFSMIAETAVVDTNYKVFKEDIGGGSFNVVIRETVVGAWQARLSTTDPDTWTAGDSVGTAYEVITGSSETQDGKSVPSSVSSKVSYVESATTSDLATEANVDAVKATTDQFAFTVANQVDANALTGGGGGTAPTVEEIRAEMDSNSTQLADIVEDTNELQTDDVPGLISALPQDKTGYTLAASEDVYHANIQLTVDGANTQDEYTVTWFKNGARITSGITSPTIQVVNRSAGTDLVASTAMTQIGSTGSYKYDEGTSRLTNGEAALVIVSASIDSGTRSFSKLLGRDASS